MKRPTNIILLENIIEGNYKEGMKAIVLGMGLQGKAVIHDLESSSLITGIFAADLFAAENSLAEADDYLKKRGYSKTKAIKLDVLKEKDLSGKFS